MTKFVDLPDEILLQILYFLNPSGDGTNPHHQRHILQRLRRLQEFPSDRLESSQMIRANLAENDILNLLAVWPRQALAMGLSCRRILCLLFSSGDKILDRIWWHNSAIYTLLTNVFPQNQTKQQMMYYMEKDWVSMSVQNGRIDRLQPKLIRRDLVRAERSVLSEPCRRFYESFLQPNAESIDWLTNEGNLSYQDMAKEAFEAKSNMILALEKRTVLEAKRYRRAAPFHLYVQIPALFIMLYAAAACLSTSFVLFTVRKSIEWNRTDTSSLPILHHVGSAALFLAFLSLLAAGSLESAREILFKPNYGPNWLYVYSVVLIPFAFLVFAVLFWIQGATPMGLFPASIVLIPLAALCIMYAISLPIMFIKAAKDAKSRTVAVGVVCAMVIVADIILAILLLFLVLVALSLELGIHVAYTFIPLYPIEILLLLYLLPSSFRSMIMCKSRELTLTFMAVLVVVSGTVFSHVMTSIWNSYAIIAPAVIPTCCLAVITMIGVYNWNKGERWQYTPTEAGQSIAEIDENIV